MTNGVVQCSRGERAKNARRIGKINEDRKTEECVINGRTEETQRGMPSFLDERMWRICN